MKAPKVSVIMPVYNGEKYLKEAIESILSQNFIDFEFIIINDGSTDNSDKIIHSYSDSRINIVNNDKNIGLINTLNKALGIALGEYIVRMDCDDISVDNRISTQVKFMDSHPNVGASGSYYNLMLNGKKALADFPLNTSEIKSFMIFNCPIAHPSAIIRNSLIKKENIVYRAEYIHSEDYDFWSEISECADLANIPAVLLNYRVHSNQITGNPALLVNKNQSLDAIRSRHLKLLNIVPTTDELIIHNLISDGRKAESDDQFLRSEAWLKKIMLENQKNEVLDKRYFEKIILERWLRLCFNYYGGRKGLQKFLNSDLNRSIKLPLKQRLEFFKNLYNSWKRKTIKN